MEKKTVSFPIRADEAKLTSGFWADRVKNYMGIIKNLEFALLVEDNAARLLNFGIAAGEVEGEFYRNDWSDGDCYKFIEGCSYQYAATGDKKVLDIINRYIPWIEAAQEPDGYIGTQTLLTDKERWQDPRQHELYNFGHLLTAGCAHYDMTGDKRLFNVAVKAADYLWEVFSPRPPELSDFGFNPSQIMGLAELYRKTKKEKYLKLADIFVTMRGTKLGLGDQNQNRVPLREEVKPVGHAVTAGYLYGGAADIYAHTGEKALIEALERIWDDMIDRRIYITGGVCPVFVGISERGDRVGEAFGDEFDLPHRISYNETCANIAIAMWAHRMFLITQDPKYYDWMETIMYNAGISGASLDMKRYFYANPLAFRKDEPVKPTFATYSHKADERWLVHDCWCCPPQLWRTFSGLTKWLYALNESGVLINMFVGSELNTKLTSGEDVNIKITTNYPWDETVEIEIRKAPAAGMELKFCIPSWCSEAAINGKPSKSGLHIMKVSPGEKINIVLPLEAKIYTANPLVEQANGMFAVKRGPIVYCVEGHDIADGFAIDELALPVNAKFTETSIDDMPYNMVGLETELVYRPMGKELYHPVIGDVKKKVKVRMIPYFAWSNRGICDMSVWLPRA